MGRNKGKQPARGKQPIEKDKDSERVNEELVQTPAEHSKDIENVDQDKGVSGGVDVDRWAEEEAEEQAASKQPSGQPSVPEGGMAGQDDEEKQQVLHGTGDFDGADALDQIDPGKLAEVEAQAHEQRSKRTKRSCYECNTVDTTMWHDNGLGLMLCDRCNAQKQQEKQEQHQQQEKQQLQQQQQQQQLQQPTPQKPKQQGVPLTPEQVSRMNVNKERAFQRRVNSDNQMKIQAAEKAAAKDLRRRQFYAELQRNAADYMNMVMQATTTTGNRLKQEVQQRITRLHHLMGLELQIENNVALQTQWYAGDVRKGQRAAPATTANRVFETT